METLFRPDMVWLIVCAALATYATRFGGYVLITRMKRIPPRMEAALSAVPAAVLTTLVVPAAVTGGIDMAFAILVALVAGMRTGTMAMLAIGWVAVMVFRQFVTG
ncbi:AzlD family protein [Shinella daejeonensis]|uniref:AzlD family protein n=1 Tax=Shinella daejeonensis TaxID=659017 RepID=UPI0020C7CFFC|nr:AzlD family protein [Shinella daejeonensis]MCP8893799.1 AzlD family protein [Shinella daejeonensis]